MTGIRALQRMNAQKLSAGDQQVRHEMRQREAAVRSDFQRALVEIETRFEKLLADETAARKELAERQEGDAHEILLFIAEVDAATNERIEETITHRIKAAWRSIVVYVAGMFGKGGVA